jgi:hypothetical protein
MCAAPKKRRSRQVTSVGTLMCTVEWFVRGVTYADDGQQLEEENTQGMDASYANAW